MIFVTLVALKPFPLLDFIKLIEQEVGKKAKQHLMPMPAGDVRETVAGSVYGTTRDLGLRPEDLYERRYC
jgi:nucleoside-diphosphate-sugar epimerase